MKIAQISDTHLGITTEGQIKVMLRALAKEEFDVLVHCGDYSGGTLGWKKVRATLNIIRSYFPTISIISVYGNHDLWALNNKRIKVETAFSTPKYVKPRPSLIDFKNNYDKMIELFKEFNVHFLDVDGIYTHPEHPHVILFGASGWYTNPNPPTNDQNFMPLGIEGHTHNYLLNLTENALHHNEEIGLVDKFDKTKQTLVFISHFPVIDIGNDYKGTFESFSWSRSIGRYYQEEYNCRYFLNGHAHQLHKGPLRWECGSDYYKPKYQIIQVK